MVKAVSASHRNSHDLRMPFGVNLAPEEFECKLHEKLNDLPDIEVLCDDILVIGYGETKEEAEANHNDNLKKTSEQSQTGETET